MRNPKATSALPGDGRTEISHAAGVPASQWAVLAAILVTMMPIAAATAQELTPDPTAWRPLAYSDLRRPSAVTRTYADIWKDALDENNRVYLARGDSRFQTSNAPATEAHFVIWSTRKSVVLSILNTATGCALKEFHAAARATIRLCPLRVAIYEGVQVRTLDGGRTCFLELAAPVPGENADPNRAVAYGSYDPSTKVVRTGLVIDHRAIDGCSHEIPLYPP